ncbi:MAG: AMIN domain-containing protein [Pseudomonadota bacterium]
MRVVLFLTVILMAFALHSKERLGTDVTNVRTSTTNGKQRIVLDINSDNEPAVYSKKAKNIICVTVETYMDQGKESQFAKLLSNTSYVKNVDFINLPDEGEVIIQLKLSGDVYDNVFTLSNPSRLVIDLDGKQS